MYFTIQLPSHTTPAVYISFHIIIPFLQYSSLLQYYVLGCYIRFSSVKEVGFSMWCVLGSPQQQRGTAAALGSTQTPSVLPTTAPQHSPPHNYTTYTHLNQSNPFHLHISHLFKVLVLVHLHMLLINKNCIFL